MYPLTTALAKTLTTALLVLTGLCACRSSTPPPEARFSVFGTEVQVLIRSDDRQATARAFRELGSLFQRLHQDWHPWQTGALTGLNDALVSGQWVETQPELIELIRSAREFEADSEGLFNAGIGALVARWGFHTSDYPITTPPPSEAAIAAWMATSPSLSQLEIDGNRVRSHNRQLQLDFSGLAKGLAGRLACDVLVRRELEEALINLGGDVVICEESQNPWKIAISDGHQGIFQTIELNGPVAVFSSGSAQRWGQWNGKRYAHLLDPRTGTAVSDAIQVTVIHHDPLRADAAATAIAIAGSDDWARIASSMQVSETLVIGESGVVRMSQGFEVRLEGSDQRIARKSERR
ncbi:MAG: FAD:protein FMN transferase [Pseudomonadota bacterium]